MRAETADGVDLAMRGNPAGGEADLSALMLRYQAGDAAAVDTLVRRLSPTLWRYLASPYVTISDTEDLLQDCWVRIHRARHTFRPEEPLLPWVFAIARHARLDAYRRRRRREARETLTDVPPERPNSIASDDEISGLLEQLPESERELLIMLKISGMSVQEVARATSSTAGAVKQKAHRAYVRLRKLIQKEGSS